MNQTLSETCREYLTNQMVSKSRSTSPFMGHKTSLLYSQDPNRKASLRRNYLKRRTVFLQICQSHLIPKYKVYHYLRRYSSIIIHFYRTAHTYHCMRYKKCTLRYQMSESYFRTSYSY